MARIVLAGSSDSVLYAHAERAADILQTRLAGFSVKKIVKVPDEWKSYVESVCHKNGWLKPSSSTLVWKECMEFGGKRLLIGGANEFLEYACCYYGLKCDLTSCDLVKFARENIATQIEVELERANQTGKYRVMKVCITHASSHVSYNTLMSLINGYMLGPFTDIDLYLYDRVESVELLRSMAMEVEDCASHVIRSVSVGSDDSEAFSKTNIVIILDEEFQEPDETNEQFAVRYWQKYHDLGCSFNQLLPDNSLITVSSKRNGYFRSNYTATALLSGLTRRDLVHNLHTAPRVFDYHSRVLLAEKLGVRSGDIGDIIVFGECAEKGLFRIVLDQAKVFDTETTSVAGPPGFSRKVLDLLHDKHWLRTEFIQKLQQRIEHEESATRHSAALSLSACVSTELRNWSQGNERSAINPLGVVSKGEYGVPAGMMFFLPVVFMSPGEFKVVDDLQLTAADRREIKLIVKRTLEERKRVLDVSRLRVGLNGKFYLLPAEMPREQPEGDDYEHESDPEKEESFTDEEEDEETEEEDDEEEEGEEDETEHVTSADELTSKSSRVAEAGSEVKDEFQVIRDDLHQLMAELVDDDVDIESPDEHMPRLF